MGVFIRHGIACDITLAAGEEGPLPLSIECGQAVSASPIGSDDETEWILPQAESFDGANSSLAFSYPLRLSYDDMALDSVDVSRKSGDEPFHHDGKPAGFGILDFWQWSASNLLNNTQRGILAEYLVAEATGADQRVRSNWENFDLETPEGIQLEVKSSAYIQSWEQSSYSDVSFDIEASQDSYAETSEEARRSDVYVFCLLDHKDQKTINPTDLSQWTFYVIATDVLDEKRPGQKSIVPNQLEEVGTRKVPYEKLGAAVREACDTTKSE